MLPSDTSPIVRPWLVDFATRARGQVPTEPLSYDELRQVTIVVDGETGIAIPAVHHQPPLRTKKGDIEKQEDQKDRW
jgi:hypothetical protein